MIPSEYLKISASISKENMFDKFLLPEKKHRGAGEVISWKISVEIADKGTRATLEQIPL